MSAPGRDASLTPPAASLVPPQLSLFHYDGERMTEQPVASLKAIAEARRQPGTVWVNLDGLGDTALLEGVADLFGLHPLAREDVVNVRQRPKVEAYDSYLFVVLRMVHLDRRSDQMSLFLGENFVLSFQEERGDCFDIVRQQLRNPDSRLRGRAADFLAYSLIDALIDHYFPLLEAHGERVETLQEEVLLRSDHTMVRDIHRLKKDLLRARRAIWPLRDELSALMRTSSLFRPETVTYLRDCYDHTLLLIDNIETLRDISAGLMDIYLSQVNTRMNDVMKTLTVISTIFIPLTFITSLYGMNFNPAASPANMPELNWRYGYPFVLGLMLVVALGTAGFMWREGWFSAFSRRLSAPEIDDDEPANDVR